MMPPIDGAGNALEPADHDGRERQQPERTERERHVALLVGEDDAGHEGEDRADPPGDQRDAVDVDAREDRRLVVGRRGAHLQADVGELEEDREGEDARRPRHRS